MDNLPTPYVISKFYQYSNRVKYFSATDSYKGTCVSCREGASWSTKTRLVFYASQHFLLCYNCQKTWSPLNWIMEVSGLSYKEVKEEMSEYDYCSFNIKLDEDESVQKTKNLHTLPYNSINLFDTAQLKYYSDSVVVQDAVKLIKTRRLDTAINKCNTFYISLEDYIHKNRLCIPFYDSDGKIRFFQTRAIYPNDEVISKYLSKVNSDKTIFGLNKIDPNLEYLFILEGPIDACFVKNGISVGGLRISNLQEQLLNKYMLSKRIWILDNQIYHEDVFKKNMDLVEKGETIFIWPKQYKQFKDLNELCCKLNLNSINPEFFIKNSYSGDYAKLQLSMMRIG